jgi:hypothetical protein
MFQTALRGAAAGVVGGLMVTLAERELVSRIAGGTPHQSEWDDRAAHALRRVGLAVEGRGAIAAGVGSQLLYGGLLGAAYAVAHERAQESRAGRTLLDGAMTYAASLVFPDVPQPKRQGRRRALRRKLVQPVNPAAAFSRATAMALGALSR